MTREQRWLTVLQSLYGPLQLPPQQPEAGSVAALRPEGLELLVPAAGGLDARLLVGRSAGIKLFSPQDVAFAQSFCGLLDKAAGERHAYVRGVGQERGRIARGLAQTEQTLGDFLADLRHDTRQRLERAGLQLDWQLDAAALHNLHLRIGDDGAGFDPDQVYEGAGTAQ
ncbi:hypothetical protein THIX_20019 [Thiomonas sp. X19]|uniref:hypothetical protein n=1 Tax=Thiomonas sp. X19 TaxID=1050370 RepID=UPI000B690AE6|nr:hypothetical protein [Thiomonas sp. X19]SCC91969.1 hypothetical protein THIX_20019 [Thiomonas sp. X19]